MLSGFTFIEQIGEGGFSSVWKVKSVQYDRFFVAKVTKVKDSDVEKAWKAFDSEIQALLRLNHPNIISLYGHFRHGSNFVMILEYLPNGSLDDFIKKRGPMEGVILIRVIKDICSALNYCWSLGVQHRDVKPQNIMFDQSGRAKLVDFGIATMKEDACARSMRIADFTCSVVCAAPEIIKNLPYDPVRSDMWATGITILWMVRGSPPWYAGTCEEVMFSITSGQYIVPKGMDREIERLARGMLAVLPKERVFPSMEDLQRLGGSAAVVKPRVQRRNIIVSASRPSSMRVSADILPGHCGMKLTKDMTSSRLRGTGNAAVRSQVFSGSSTPRGDVHRHGGGKFGLSPLSPLADKTFADSPLDNSSSLLDNPLVISSDDEDGQNDCVN